jgi:hypothetical protein
LQHGFAAIPTSAADQLAAADTPLRFSKGLRHSERKTPQIATNFHFCRKIDVTNQILDAE